MTLSEYIALLSRKGDEWPDDTHIIVPYSGDHAFTSLASYIVITRSVPPDNYMTGVYRYDILSSVRVPT